MKVYYNLFVLISAFLFFSCEEESNSLEDCNLESRICTEEFRSVELEIVDDNGEYVELDNFYTFFDSRKKFEFSRNTFQQENGLYPVITDAELEELNQEGSVLVFVGEIEGKNVIEHQMLIGHDCCHVELIQGETKLILKNL
ncbi:hypothetical protein QYS48_26800 [Marivirga arenosa]|uniref:Lipoprotein n=1 Tax=Marivirga arenosa TaxID=3059076 RepID=A0AA49GED6_9BACT|nr:hypothetical protein [Marivirga sp. ABR2-2]WKK85459.2 hypothetical protein QYS48_26800 [Marivirga sp. ABR2-2]